MNWFKTIFSLVLVSLTFPSCLAADALGTNQEAEAILKKAIEHIKKAGPAQAFKDFTDKKPPFVDRDLYVTVYDSTGKNLAHGANPKMVGKDLIEMQDADGKYFVKERVELMRVKKKFSHDYKFTDPVTKKILPKTMFCESIDSIENTIACVGVYKR